MIGSQRIAGSCVRGSERLMVDVVGVDRLAGDAGLQVLVGSRQRAHREPRRPKGRVSDDRERGIIGSVRSVQHAANSWSRHAMTWASPRPCNHACPVNGGCTLRVL